MDGEEKGQDKHTPDTKLEVALAAVNSLFSDTSVSQHRTRELLQALKDEIDILLDSLGGSEAL